MARTLRWKRRSATYKANGKVLREDARITFVLTPQAGAWKIASWTWTGPDPEPDK
jgi:hypothetical protein